MLSVKILLLVGSALAIAAAPASQNDMIVGGVQPLTGDQLKEAESTLQHSLQVLKAGEGPEYELSKIHWATSQVVSGILYKYNVDLKDSNNAIKTCNVSIWSQPWLENGNEVTFECPGEAKVVKRHN